MYEYFLDQPSFTHSQTSLVRSLVSLLGWSFAYSISITLYDAFLEESVFAHFINFHYWISIFSGEGDFKPGFWTEEDLGEQKLDHHLQVQVVKSSTHPYSYHQRIFYLYFCFFEQGAPIELLGCLHFASNQNWTFESAAEGCVLPGQRSCFCLFHFLDLAMISSFNLESDFTIYSKYFTIGFWCFFAFFI